MMKEVIKREKGRKWLNFQFMKLKQVAVVGSLVILLINLALNIYPLVAHRFPEKILMLPKSWVIIPLLFIFVLFIIWLLAHLWVMKFEMYRTQQRARMILNPYNIYHFNPFQIMRFRNIFLPIMYSQLEMMEEGKDKERYKKQIKMIEKWLELGYIPKEDFPDDLKEYYLTDKDNKL